jgi:hypothetical protein
MTKPKYKTTLVAQAKLLDPTGDKFKAVASTLKGRYGFDLVPQMDLLYLESCLVTAGNRHGINQNDDVFTPEEAWAARTSPVLKPFNWQHNDKDIVGVMYSVQARDLSGNVLDFDSETPPAEAFDLWTEAVLFRLIHPERVSEAEARARAGDLYVSMEAWFDDYAYAFCDGEGVVKTVARNESTSFLDGCLKANGGNGKYEDPDSGGQEVRITRVLRDITFGGCGLVNRPANERSVIETAVPSMEMSKSGIGDIDEVKLLLQRVLESVTPKGEALMNANANANEQNVDIQAAIGSALDEREARQRAEAELTNLRQRVEAAEAKVKELEAEQAQGGELSTKLEAANEQIQRYEEALHGVFDAHNQSEAGASNDNPTEIAVIDNAQSGEEKFNAKIAWINNSTANLKTRAARADELETQLSEAESVVREQQVRALLQGKVSDESLEIFVASASELEGEDFSRWLQEKELMLLETTKAMPKTKTDKEGKKWWWDEKAKKWKPAKGAAESTLEAMLRQRRADSGYESGGGGTSGPTNQGSRWADPDADPKALDHIINPEEGEHLNSGVGPDQLRTPRHKIAGSAEGGDVLDLDDFQEEDGVNLAAATAGDGGESNVSPFRVLARAVTQKKTEAAAKDKPGFDPAE